MSDIETEFHKQWLGMVQPTEGLVVSVPVLVQAEAMRRLSPADHHRFVELCLPIAEGSPHRAIASLDALLEGVLELRADLFDRGEQLPADLRCDVVEGHQTLRPTLALRRQGPAPAPDSGASTPGAIAGSRYVALVWDLPDGLELDKPETTTGPWHYPPSAKFDRLLRECRVPIGLLTNRRAVRLVYAPHGESTGSITFRVNDMASVGGRPIFDAFVMLLSATRFFGVAQERQLPALLRESRLRQANVTTALAEQVFEALELLLAGFEAAAERDGQGLLRDALEREDDHLYGGLLTVLLRLVFVLYAEDRGLMPVESGFYSKHLSVLELHEHLQRDHGLYPDSMHLRFGAWGRLLTLFRAVFLGVEHGDLTLPQRRGDLFNPHLFPFLEGWGPGGAAPITLVEDRAGVRVPTVSDGTIYEVLHRLLFLEGQRLSYRALDVEQIGSVYEALMGYHVRRLEASAVCIQPRRAWVEGATLLAAQHREAWLQDEAGLGRKQAAKLVAMLKGAKDEEAVLEILGSHAVPRTGRAPAGRLVLQPGAERRRTSSHYTPRSLSAPIVRRTLEPLFAAMKPFPTAKGILELKICDPAMGSGAFLVEACRFLADQLVAAWSREKELEQIATQQPDVLHHARRLIAQRCLYGVDKNPFAVGLAKLSLWLATLAKELPFTFLDHALRCGDSLVGLSFEQVVAFDWAPSVKEEPKEDKGKGKGKKAKAAKASAQLELFGKELEQALSEAIGLRQQICDLASDPTPEGQREKERLLQDAEDAMNNVRLAADVCVGAFFAADTDSARKTERQRRQVLVERWLRTREPPTAELLELQADLHSLVRPFHWGVEFPEVFYLERPDPLESGQVNREALIDGFVGNPPYMTGREVSANAGRRYNQWLVKTTPGTLGTADLAAFFLRRCFSMLGKYGALGFLTTKSLAEGDSLRCGIKRVMKDGGVLTDPLAPFEWPGSAGVDVIRVHVAKGLAFTPVAQGSDRGALDHAKDAPTAKELNECPAASQGCILYPNELFLLDAETTTNLLASSPSNSDVVKLLLGVEHLNDDPEQRSSEHVVYFADLPLEDAEAWPEALSLVQERVPATRGAMKTSDASIWLNEHWWTFWRPRAEHIRKLQQLERYIAVPRVSVHGMFSFLQGDLVFKEDVLTIASDCAGLLAVLQSRVHLAWAWRTSSSRGSTGRVRWRYSLRDALGTFPLPSQRQGADLVALGEQLSQARAAFMAAERKGMAQLYDMLEDRTCAVPEIVDLRSLHEAIDRAVLAAYVEHAGWPAIAVPAYGTPSNDEERAALEEFEDEVIDLLYSLNAERFAAADDDAAEEATAPSAKRSGSPRARAPEGEAEMFEA